MATTTKHVVVVGGGLGGLAAAAVAAARGHRVTLLDKNPWLGGKAAVLNLPAPDGSGSFRFDMGPTFFLYPRVLYVLVVRIVDFLDLLVRNVHSSSI